MVVESPPRSRRGSLPPTGAPLPEHPGSTALGRDADHPGEIPWRGWLAVLRRTGREMISDRVSLVAAGCAFYATLALFPAMTMLITIYGMMFDPVTVEPQLQTLREFLPPEAFGLISDRLHMLVAQPVHQLGTGLLISTLVTFWSSATGTKGILSALNLAYEESEKRSFLRFQLTAFVITIGAVLAAVTGLALLLGMPALLGFLGLSDYATGLIRIASLGGLVVFVMAALSLLYRFGPSRRRARWQWITTGSLVATLLWLAASSVFSLYVGRLSSYDMTYGPLAAGVGVMMWFYVSVFVVLLGAELNAELELQTRQDSTEGAPRPMGQRGAHVADHVANE